MYCKAYSYSSELFFCPRFCNTDTDVYKYSSLTSCQAKQIIITLLELCFFLSSKINLWVYCENHLLLTAAKWWCIKHYIFFWITLYIRREYSVCHMLLFNRTAAMNTRASLCGHLMLYFGSDLFKCFILTPNVSLFNVWIKHFNTTDCTLSSNRTHKHQTLILSKL